MNDINNKQSPAQKAVAQAKREVEEEGLEKATAKLKDLYRQRKSAETILANVDREIADYEEAVNQGNFDG